MLQGRLVQETAPQYLLHLSLGICLAICELVLAVPATCSELDVMATYIDDDLRFRSPVAPRHDGVEYAWKARNSTTYGSTSNITMSRGEADS